MDRRGQGKRQSSLPSSLLPHLVSGPQPRRSATVEPAPAGSPSGREEGSEEGSQQESPYASHPVPSFPTPPVDVSFRLTRPAFPESSGGTSRRQHSGSPESLRSGEEGRARRLEGISLPPPVSRPGTIPVRTDPQLYTSNASLLYGYTWPGPALPPFSWREGEAGPGPSSSQFRLDASSRSSPRPVRGLPQIRQGQAAAVASRHQTIGAFPPAGLAREFDTPGGYGEQRHNIGHSGRSRHESLGSLHRTHLEGSEEYAFQFVRPQPRRLVERLGGGETVELSPTSGSARYDTEPLDRIPSFFHGPATEGLPGPSTYPVHTRLEGVPTLPPLRSLSVVHAHGSRSIPEVSSSYLEHRSSFHTSGTSGDDEDETEGSISQEKGRDGDSDGGQSAKASKRKARSASLEENDQRRKIPRKTEVACNFCRGRKLRCDGQRPTCRNCSQRKNVCVYAPHARRRGPGKAPRGSRKLTARARTNSSASTSGEPSTSQTPIVFGAQPPHDVLAETQFTFTPPAGVHHMPNQPPVFPQMQTALQGGGQPLDSRFFRLTMDPAVFLREQDTSIEEPCPHIADVVEEERQSPAERSP
ncbi:hypothetical protein AcW1_007499 [Taiwanofungus camphoratus]|nr:hypothetical protein AcV5_007777 [Antrodia cinnamomea]KAI0947223.1 hypothetical protein AcV7_009699 [Antrodia cinnamomea]KAI0953225.1 hypothetical protein AcW1_007499 [Antrodia cinnamomea]